MPDPLYPLQTWPDGATPTVDQLRDWVHAHGPHHDARVAANMLLGMYAVERLHGAELAAQVAAVDEVLTQLSEEQRDAVYQAVRDARAARGI